MFVAVRFAATAALRAGLLCWCCRTRLGCRTSLRCGTCLLCRTSLLRGASLLRLGAACGTSGVLRIVLSARCTVRCLHSLRVIRMRHSLMEGLGTGTRCGRDCRLTVVYRCELRPVLCCGMLMLLL